MGRDIHLELYRCANPWGKSATSSDDPPGEILNKVELFFLVLCVLTLAPRCVAGPTNNIPTNSTLLDSNLLWLSSTNPVGSRVRWGSTTNGQFGVPFWWMPLPQPAPTWTSSNHHLKISNKWQPMPGEGESEATRRIFKLQSSPQRLGDYWLPGEFERITGRPRQSTLDGQRLIDGRNIKEVERLLAPPKPAEPDRN